MKIVLASKSPRRKEILSKFLDEFACINVDIDEKFELTETPEQIVMSLSLQKALAAETMVEEGQLIIASDTIVYKDEVLCKPTDHANAVETLQKLSGTTHQVYTGIAVVLSGSNKRVVTYSSTDVEMNDLSDTVIKSYIESGEVWDKAGAYGIQGKGSILVNKIDGDFFGVMGLPISLLNKVLKEEFGFDLMK